MSFLNQLKTQANSLQSEQQVRARNLEVNAVQTEAACKTTWHYFSDLVKQLNVIVPDGPAFTLDGKTPWPAVKMLDFRLDARKKNFQGREIHDVIAMGWQIVPKTGAAVGGMVSANFPPDLERIQKRLALGNVQHERRDVRHPEKNTLQEVRFEYIPQSRGNVTVTADHDNAKLHFRLVNTMGFDVVNVSYPAEQIQTDVLDELAKLLLGHPSAFV